MLKGKNVLLRPVKMSDLPMLLKWFNDPEITQYLLIYLPIMEIGERKWIEDLNTIKAASDLVFIIEAIEKSGNVPIGDCGLHHINQKDQNAELGIAIGEKKYWSKGFGTEAARLLIDYGFNQLNLNRIYAGAIEYNKKSIGMQKKVGFKREGCQRKAIFKNGRFWNLFISGMLRNEWKKENYCLFKINKKGRLFQLTLFFLQNKNLFYSDFLTSDFAAGFFFLKMHIITKEMIIIASINMLMGKTSFAEPPEAPIISPIRNATTIPMPAGSNASHFHPRIHAMIVKAISIIRPILEDPPFQFYLQSTNCFSNII